MELGPYWMILLFASCQLVSVTGNDDFFTVHRMSKNGYSPDVRTEIHRETNALGLPLRTRNGFFIDSVEGMPSLMCSPAIKDCKWLQSGNWVYSDIDPSVDAYLSINIDKTHFNLHGYYETCDEYNGGCEMYCLMRANYPICTCPNNLYINETNMSCQEGTQSTILSSGSFSEDAPISNPYFWYFIPPVNTTLRLNLAERECNYDLSARELNRNRDIFGRGNGGGKNITSEHAIELSYNGYYTTHCTSIEGRVEFTRSHLTLDGQSGTLQYFMTPTTENICVSVIYKSQSRSASLNLSVRLENGTNIQANKFQERQIGMWQQKRFHAELGEVSSLVRLLLEIEGAGTIIYSINGCSPYGNQEITITNNKASPPSRDLLVSHPLVDKDDNCLNGGSLNEDTGKCVCPAGFGGSNCEQGCGPNFYGHDCSMTCSDFKWGCLGMLFCKPHLPCLCAAGYKGEGCDEECEDGTYGPNCQEVCGQCNFGVCDKFTGLCHTGCKPGLYPPYCVKKYKYLQNAPEIELLDLHEVYMASAFISFDPASTYGEGNLKYYQVQYYNTEKKEDWVEMQAEKLNNYGNIVYHGIAGLSPGRKYVVRVVLFDADGGTYQGPLVPTEEFTSLCSRLISKEYNIKHKLTESGFLLQWQYALNETDCPVTGYTVTLRRNWQQLQFHTRQTEIEFHNLLGGTEYEVKVKGESLSESTPSSAWYVVKTSNKAPAHVKNLQAVAKGDKQLLVSWLQPTGGALQKYVIRYKCMQYLACPTSNEESEEIEVTVGANETSLILEDLRSHAAYRIEVAGVTNDLMGPFTSTKSVTQDSEPDVCPSNSENPILSSTNTTITVQWLESEECSSFNGYLMGYHYELLHSNGTKLKEGNTLNTKLAFTDLIPRTTYLVNVYVLSSGGWNKNKKITISASTQATVPEMVQNLTAYKRGRREIGLRWSKPDNSFGAIKSFLVSYCEISGGCENEVSLPTDPIPCSAWPEQFCFTINNLRSNTKYSLSVRAQNNEVDEYGSSATITTVTSEGVPQAPIGLRVQKLEHQAVTLEWKPPLIYNGILRSFLVNVEHIDSANSSNCCNYYPLQEMLVKSEYPSFSFEVLDLSPASKYTIGISSKTVSIGPSATITVNTPPEVPEFQPPQMLDGSTVLIPKQTEYLGLSSKFLLVIVSEYEGTPTDLCDKDVMEKIREVTENFYVVDEFDNDDLPAEVPLGSGEGLYNGTYCILQNRSPPATFRVGLALVLDYNGSKNVKFVVADAPVPEDNSE